MEMDEQKEYNRLNSEKSKKRGEACDKDWNLR